MLTQDIKSTGAGGEEARKSRTRRRLRRCKVDSRYLALGASSQHWHFSQSTAAKTMLSALLRNKACHGAMEKGP